MINLRSRIERLERRAESVAGCETCKGQGWGVIVIEQPPLPEIRSGACPQCGREGPVKIIKLSGEGGGWDAL